MQWSYSHLDAFETCPKKFYHIRVAKDIIEPAGEAAEWGTRVHEALENYIKEGTELPNGMEQWEGIVQKIKKLRGVKHTEIAFAIDKSFQPTDWKSAWSRGLADVFVIDGTEAIVLDYKTGKRKITDQLKLYAAYVFAHYPDVEVVKTGFVWLKTKKIDRDVYTRDQLADLWKDLLPRVRRLEIAYEKNKWEARPSGLCRGWCPVKTCTFYKAR